MLEVADATRAIAIVGDRRARKIQRTPGAVGDDFHRVGIVDVASSTRRLDGANLYRMIFHQREKRRDMFRAGQRLIALDVDIDVSGHPLCHLMNSLRTAAVRRRCQPRRPAILLANVQYLLRVGGHNNVRQFTAGTRCLIHVRQHGPPADFAQNLARQPCRCQPRRNDGDGFHRMEL